MITRRSLLPAACLLLLTAGSFSAAPAAMAVPGSVAGDPALWPEPQRAFFQDGPALLLSKDARERFVAEDEAGRQRMMDTLLGQDPIPETTEDELAEGIHRRQQLVRSEGWVPGDARAQVLFLNGPPDELVIVDCGSAFKPLQLWGYGAEKARRRFAVLYQPASDQHYRLWLPSESKRVLYTPELEYYLEQWEELRGFIRGKRFDHQLCDDAKRVDRITGVDGLFGYEKDRPTDRDLMRFLSPPEDLGAWARMAAATVVPELPKELPTDLFELQFPRLDGQRMLTRILVRIPADTELQVAEPDKEGKAPELDVTATGTLEHLGTPFDTFRVRYNPEATEPRGPLALVLERPLRPGMNFVLRLVVKDELGGAEALFVKGFRVPDEPIPVPEPEYAGDVLTLLGEQMAEHPMVGLDSLILVPPESDIVVGLWRAEALVTGARIAKVAFSVDGQLQLTRPRPPFSAEVRLSKFPVEQVVRVEGFDADGELVAADEVVLNQPRGALRVRILEPARGSRSAGQVTARAEVIVPEGKRVEKVVFLVDDKEQVTLERPPWQATVTAPEDTELSYLTVVAHLDDGNTAEDVRFLRSPDYLEEVDVNLVELFTTVTERGGTPVRGLTADDFEVLEDGRPQKLSKFELVEDLPLMIGITIDTSGSMTNSIVEAQRAAEGFLSNIVTRRDRCFAISFSDRPIMLMPPTNDVEAVARSLDGLAAVGWTALHDAIVQSLYYFRGVRGRRALVLLSDGDDTASNIAFRDALEYARRSGVAIYTIGLNVGSLDLSIRDKLKSLSEETGGRVFFVKNADELSGVYAEIEEELRSQYLLAYNSENPKAEPGAFRSVEVKVKGRGFKARTTRGYYP